MHLKPKKADIPVFVQILEAFGERMQKSNLIIKSTNTKLAHLSFAEVADPTFLFTFSSPQSKA